MRSETSRTRGELQELQNVKDKETLRTLKRKVCVGQRKVKVANYERTPKKVPCRTTGLEKRKNAKSKGRKYEGY